MLCSVAKLCVSFVTGGGTQAGTSGLPGRSDAGGLNEAVEGPEVMVMMDQVVVSGLSWLNQLKLGG